MSTPETLLEYRAFPPGRIGIVRDGVELDTLPLYIQEKKHSPSGFSWGYNGSGPAQLAYALLRHALDDKARAERWYQRYKEEHIAPRHAGRTWKTTNQELRRIVEAYEAESAAPLAFYIGGDREMLWHE